MLIGACRINPHDNRVPVHPFQNAMSVREETFTPFSVQALRPKNKTEGKIYRYDLRLRGMN